MPGEGSLMAGEPAVAAGDAKPGSKLSVATNGEPAAHPVEAAPVQVTVSAVAEPPLSIPGPPPDDEDTSPPEPATYEEPLEDYPDLPQVRAGDICKGRVVSVSEEGLIVDIGGKTEGLVPLADLGDNAGETTVEADSEIEVFVVSLGPPGDYATLSYRRARQRPHPLDA